MTSQGDAGAREPVELLLRHLRSTPEGLTQREAERRLLTSGPNVIRRHAGATWPRLLLDQIIHPLALLLWVAAGLAMATSQWAIALAIGIGIQNFPEGLAVAVPLRRNGISRFKSFWYGQLSAIVEPIAGVIGAIAVIYMQPVLPFALAFAAGAMIYVVVEEVIPETQRDRFTDISVLGFIGGFLVMMILDVALG